MDVCRESVYERDFLSRDPKRGEIEKFLALLQSDLCELDREEEKSFLKDSRNLKVFCQMRNLFLNIPLPFQGPSEEAGDRRVAVYYSMPLTTGKRMYETMLKYGVRTAEELKRISPLILVEEIMKPNIAEAQNFVKALRQSGRPVIAPAELDAKVAGWKDQHYIYFWYWVIYHWVKTIRFMPGWEFSNGCVREYVRGFEYQGGEYGYPYDYRKWTVHFYRAAAKRSKRIEHLDRRKPKYHEELGKIWGPLRQRYRRKFALILEDHEGREIFDIEAKEKIAKAIFWLKEKGLPYLTLLEFFRRLECQSGWDGEAPHDPQVKTVWQMAKF